MTLIFILKLRITHASVIAINDSKCAENPTRPYSPIYPGGGIKATLAVRTHRVMGISDRAAADNDGQAVTLEKFVRYAAFSREAKGAALRRRAWKHREDSTVVGRGQIFQVIVD